MCEKYEVISSCINSVIMVTLLSGTTSMKSSGSNFYPTWNYWRAETTLAMELNAHVPQLTEAENSYRSFESKLREYQLDEKELSLLLLMIITRTSEKKNISQDKRSFLGFFLLDLNVMSEENKSWSKCQFECVQAFSEYTQGEKFKPFDFI
jgi:hypothetical protein